MKFSKKFLTFFICLSFFIIFSLPASAQTTAPDLGLHLTTSPLPINLITTPGSTVSAQLKVKNSGTKKERITLGLMKFSSYGEEGKPKLLDREPGDDYFDWITFSEPEFDLLPNEWRTITATFKVPKSAAFGYYYAVTFSRSVNQEASGPRITNISGEIATLVLLEVRSPNIKREMEVLDFSSDRNLYEFLPANFSIKLKNKGNVHVSPHGNIFIDRGDVKDIAILDINSVKGNVLPTSNRIFNTKWEDGFPIFVEKTQDGKTVLDKNGNIETTLKWDFSQVAKLRWGKYTANMLLIYDDGTRDVTIEGKTSFWVVPWRLIGGTIVVMIFILIGLQSTLKRIFGIFKK